MSQLFPTKFVVDTGTAVFYSTDTLDAQLTVNETVILRETYSPSDGQITIRGLRSILEAAIYGELIIGSQPHASANVKFTIGNNSETATLYASRLKNPRDPNGQKNILAAGDLVAVKVADGDFITPAYYTRITLGSVCTETLQNDIDGQLLGDDIRLWVECASCTEDVVAVRFLNRYDVPQTMMTTRPLETKPIFQDQTALIYGQRVRYSVEQQDEYILRSGKIHSRSEYASWYDLITSRKAEVWLHNQWLPILVKKSNFSLVHRSVGMNPVEITFQMADPKQGL